MVESSEHAEVNTTWGGTQTPRISVQIAKPATAPEAGAKRLVAAGTVLDGRYRLEHSLSRNGMREVWAARHIDLGIRVAIKIPLYPLVPEAAARFRAEARATAELRSQNVVHVNDYGVDDGIAYIAMELLEGETLDNRLSRRRRLSLREASIVAKQAARGLCAAHERGMVHQDIKPSHLFLATLDGERVLKVLAFGVAQMRSEGAPVDGSSAKDVGVSNYLSPEQVRGLPVDLRADLWSLAAVLFRALAGVEPFGAGSSADTLAKIRDSKAPSLRVFAPELPPEIDAFFGRALARDPRHRFESARQLSCAFEQIAACHDPGTDAEIGYTAASSGSLPPSSHATGRDMTVQLENAVFLGPPGTVIRVGNDPSCARQFKLAAGVAPIEQTNYGRLRGVSLAMRRLFAVLARLEVSLVSTLIEGESGTGKEVVARAIHEHSARSRGPFVAVNCGALERPLVRSELFGHRRGAFTSAVEGRLGAFELASGGTLFLDEIGELPLDIQPVLLRALESESVVRVGETVERPINVRLIAATNRDLEADVRTRRFREDLYYRLKVVKLRIPPLRERMEDIVALAEHFAEELNLGPLSPQILTELCTRPWPGNVRELKNTLKAYSAIGALPSPAADEGGSLESALRGAVDLTRPYAERKQEVVEVFRKVYVERLLEHTSGNQSEAARLSGLERSYLNKVVNAMGVRK